MNTTQNFPGSSGDNPTRPMRTIGLPDVHSTLPTKAMDTTALGADTLHQTGAGSTRPQQERGLQRGDEPDVVFARRFEVVRRLGAGGMGEVYLVRDRHIEQREVALKILKPRYSSDSNFRALFFREIRTAQGFVSEHVVQVRDCGETDEGQLFFTMDFVEGEDLSALLRREPALGLRHALEITRQVLLGLGSGHEQGFIHRDVKPQNIMLAARTPKTSTNPHGVKASILDFGIGGLVEDLVREHGSGTPQYMSPEQVQGQRLDPRSDLFSVGLILFEMLTGKRPIEAPGQAELQQTLLEIDFDRLVNDLGGVPSSIRRLLRRALQKERSKRFESAAAFVEALDRTKTLRPATSAPGWLVPVSGLLAITTVGLGGMRGMDYIQGISTKAIGDFSTWQGEDLRTQVNEAERKIEELKRELEKTQAEAAASRAEIERAKSNLGLQTGNLALEKSGVAIQGVRDVTHRRRYDEILKGLQARYSAFTVNLSMARRIGSTLDDLLAIVADPRSSDPLWASARLDDQLQSLESAQVSGARTFVERKEARILEYLIALARAEKQVFAIGETEVGRVPNFAAIAAAAEAMNRLRSKEISDLQQGTIDGQPWLGLRALSPSEVEAKLGKLLTSQLSAEQRAQVQEGLVLPAEYLPKSEELDQEIWGESYEEALAESRLERVKQAIARLDGLLSDKASEVDRVAKLSAEELLAATPVDPQVALGYFRVFGVYSRPYAQEILTLMLGQIESAVLREDCLVPSAGEILRPHQSALCSLVAEHTSNSEADSDPGDFSLDNPLRSTVERLRWLALAATWYGGGTVEAADPAYGEILRRYVEATVGVPASEIESLPAWAGVLVMQIRLSQVDINQVYPTEQISAAFAVYVSTADEQATVETIEEWETLTLKRPFEIPELSRRTFRPGAGELKAPGSKPVVWSSRRIEVEGATLELRRPPGKPVTQLGNWTPRAELIARFALEKSGQLASFRHGATRLSSESGPGEGSGRSWPCLRLSSAGGEIWICPELGIVREVRPARIRELVAKY